MCLRRSFLFPMHILLWYVSAAAHSVVLVKVTGGGLDLCIYCLTILTHGRVRALQVIKGWDKGVATMRKGERETDRQRERQREKEKE